MKIIEACKQKFHQFKVSSSVLDTASAVNALEQNILIEDGKLTIPKYLLSAVDLLIVSHPGHERLLKDELNLDLRVYGLERSLLKKGLAPVRPEKDYIVTTKKSPYSVLVVNSVMSYFGVMTFVNFYDGLDK